MNLRTQTENLNMSETASNEWKTTVIEVRNKGEWGTFFVRESPIVPREGKGVNASAEWCCNSSFGTFGHYWSSMGEPFGKFISGISGDYLLGKIGKRVTDSTKVAKELRRLVRERRREKGITKDEAREAMDDIDAIVSEHDGEWACHAFYESVALSKCEIEWCDVESQTWDSQSIGFYRNLWPLFVKQFNEAKQQAA